MKKAPEKVNIRKIFLFLSIVLGASLVYISFNYIDLGEIFLKISGKAINEIEKADSKSLPSVSNVYSTSISVTGVQLSPKKSPKEKKETSKTKQANEESAECFSNNEELNPKKEGRVIMKSGEVYKNSCVGEKLVQMYYCMDNNVEVKIVSCDEDSSYEEYRCVDGVCVFNEKKIQLSPPERESFFKKLLKFLGLS